MFIRQITLTVLLLLGGCGSAWSNLDMLDRSKQISVFWGEDPAPEKYREALFALTVKVLEGAGFEVVEPGLDPGLTMTLDFMQSYTFTEYHKQGLPAGFATKKIPTGVVIKIRGLYVKSGYQPIALFGIGRDHNPNAPKQVRAGGSVYTGVPDLITVEMISRASEKAMDAYAYWLKNMMDDLKKKR